MIPKFLSEKVSNRLVWIFPLLFAIFAFIKTQNLFLHPRFWAEEGSGFFQKFWMQNFFDCILYTYNGNYLFLTNLSTFLATLVPLKYSPAITTYFTFFVHLLVALQIGLFAKEYKIAFGTGLLLIVAWAFLPATYEVWLTATNIQWMTGVSMLLVLVQPGSALDRQRALYLLWTAICGLSGAPATILAPLFVGRFLVEKNKTTLCIGLILGSEALLQIAIMTHSTITNRHFSLEPVGVLTPFALQTSLVSLLGVSLTESVASHIRTTLPYISVWTYSVLVAAATLMVVAFIAAWNSSYRLVATYVLLSAILVSTVQAFGALGDPTRMISSMAGGRYFLSGQIAFCLILALGTISSNEHLKRLAVIMLVMICTVAITQKIVKPQFFRPILTGPPWPQQVEQCKPDYPCRLEIWPPGWHVDLKL